MNLLWPPTTNFPKVMDLECKLKSPKSTVKKIIEAKESQKEQAHFTPTSPRKNRTVCPDLCPEMHALAKMAEMAINPQNRQTVDKNSNEMAKGPFGNWRFWRKWCISPKSPVSKGPLLASNSNGQRLAIFRHFRHCMHSWT